jgi:hypothetical protein
MFTMLMLFYRPDPILSIPSVVPNVITVGADPPVESARASVIKVTVVSLSDIGDKVNAVGDTAQPATANESTGAVGPIATSPLPAFACKGSLAERVNVLLPAPSATQPLLSQLKVGAS